MPILKPEDVNTEPTVTLVNWRISEVSIPASPEPVTHHLIGVDAAQGIGRVSSPIRRLDPERRTVVTRSGRVYKLCGRPGGSLDADYVWSRWKRINHVEAESDITAAVFELLEIVASKKFDVTGKNECTSPDDRSMLTLKIDGLNGTAVKASVVVIRPTEQDSGRTTMGIVEWEGAPMVSSIVTAVCDSSLSEQLLEIVEAAFGTHSKSQIPALSAEGWTRATIEFYESHEVKFPYLTLSISRDKWTAHFTVLGATSQEENSIPLDFRTLDIGPLLTELLRRFNRERLFAPGESQ